MDTSLAIVVRAHDDVTTLAPAVKKAIWSVDQDRPIVRVVMMDDLLARSASERRFVMIVFEAFALVALVLAATGIYDVLSGSVAERMRKIGVRSALGASRASILALVVRQGMTLTGLGVVIGLGGAMFASRALVTMLFGVSRLDPITHLGVIALLVGVGGGRMLGTGVARGAGRSGDRIEGGVGRQRAPGSRSRNVQTKRLGERGELFLSSGRSPR
jgi:ABC-type antimicrobial peptide transport system permease subunit